MESLHGGDIYTDGLLNNKNIIDFSSNINPYGVSDKIKENIYKFWDEVVRYPDFKYRLLKESISCYIKKYYNININHCEIMLGNGAVEIIDILISNIQNITIICPSFIEYEIIANKYNKKIIFSKLDFNMQYNYDEIKKSILNTDAIIIGNPNNPSGNIININLFKEILLYCEEKNKKVLVDEAFIEFCSNNISLIHEINNYKCIFIIRAFTKFFGMPGARIGYCISRDIQTIKLLSQRQLVWNINSFSEYALINAYKDESYIINTKKWIKKEMPYMSKKLKNIKFIDKVYPTNCNFILCRLKYIDSNELYKKMFDSNILIRKCNNFRELDNNYIRLAIKSRKLNNILLEKLEKLY